MRNHWMKSFWTKLIAACFIGLVILGNIWLAQRFSLDVPPVWIQTCFAALSGAIFLFGAALGAEQLLAKFSADDEAQMERERDEEPSDGRNA